MLNNFLTPEGARLVQKYLGRTWSAFILTAAIGGSIGNNQEKSFHSIFVGYLIHRHLESQEPSTTPTKEPKKP